MYKYGMRSRHFSIGCQPMNGLDNCEDDDSGKYYNILTYTRKLDDNELYEYELDYIERTA